jgi:protein arginine N-methyltransferase 1
MYDLIGYGGMIADRVRTDAYARALREAVKPDSVVLDIGTGTGLFALLACRFGARRVYAIDPSEAIALARDIARANGYADRINFIQGVSERATLPELMDIIVSDIRGVLPLHQNSVGTILDARRRFLAPGGTLIPEKDRMMVAVVDAPKLYEKHARPWEAPVHGLDMTAARRFAANTWHYGRAAPEQLLLAPQSWAELDYRTLEVPGVRGGASWTAERAGTAHGLSVWFNCELAPGVTYSNAPDQPELVYGSAFFPLSEPVVIAVGDRLDVSLRADLVTEDYTWSWNTTVRDSRPCGALKADFKQSSFFSLPILQSQLHKRAASHRPTLTEDGEIALLVLRLMNEEHPLEYIARQLCARFPARFTDWIAALPQVGAFSAQYSDASAGAGDSGDPRATSTLSGKSDG